MAEVEAALDYPADPTAAAFFDVDNTVMQGASIFHLARGLHRRKFFTTRDILGAAWKQAYFRFVGVEDPEHVAEARASALAFIEGHTVAELEELGEEIFDEAMAHRIWPGTRALAQLHLDQGQRVWLVTAAPVEIAQIIARRLGLTGALGTVAEHRRRRLHRAAGRRHAARPGQGRGDQGAGGAGGPGPGPLLGVLRLLQRPADAVASSATRARSTPTRKLRAHAREQGWRIRDYRTGRKAARVGLVVAAVAGAVAGAVAAGVSLRAAALSRRRALRRAPPAPLDTGLDHLQNRSRAIPGR